MDNTSVEIYPILAMSAIKQHGAAWRVLTVSRFIDKDGSGRVSVRELEGTLRKYLSEQSTRYQINQALKAGFIREDKVGEYYYYISPKKLANLLNINHFDHRKISVPLEQLFSKEWRKVVWASALEETTSYDKPISRQSIKEITGVNKLRQIRNERNSNQVIKKANAVDTGFDATHITGLQKLGGGYFALGNRVYKRIGNTYIVANFDILKSGRGRCKKIKTTDNLFSTERIPSVRYLDNGKQAERLARHDTDNTLYLYSGKISSYNIWRKIK